MTSDEKVANLYPGSTDKLGQGAEATARARGALNPGSRSFRDHLPKRDLEIGKLTSEPIILFGALSEDHVWASLDDPVSNNPIAGEVSRLVLLYANASPHHPNLKHASAIERVAFELAMQYL